MTTIVTRSGKGSPLTHTEVDTNFTNLNTAKLEAGAIALGSAATPSISFTGDTNTGIFSPGADQVAVATNGVQRINIEADGDINIDGGGVFYDATNNRLAIGTTSPINKLDVNGSISAFGAFSNTGFAPHVHIGLSGGNPCILAGNNVAATFLPLVFRQESSTGASEAMRIDPSGRLLVGTSNTLAGATDSLLQIRGNSSGSQFAGKIALATEVAVASIVSGTDLGAIYFGNTANGVGGLIECKGDAQWSTAGGGDYPGRLVFSTTADGASSPTERMRITSGGIIRFSGSTNTVEINPQGCTLYRTGANMAGIALSTTCILPTDNTGNVNDNVASLGNAQFRWSVVFAGTGTINTSDATLKQDVENLEQTELDVATTIKGLIKKFRFIDAVADKGDDARIHVGVIAQEVEQAFADKGLDPRRYALFCEDTLEDGSKRLGIRYDELLAFVIASL